MLKKNIALFLATATIVVITFLLFGSLENFFVALLKNTSTNRTTYSSISFLVLSSDIILPVPSSIVMYLNGYVLGAVVGSFISLISLLASSIIGYYIGKFTSLGLKSKSEKRADIVLSKYGTLAILITRGIPILSESVCVVCGYNKVPFKQYFIFNLIGYMPLCLLYAICGSLGYDKNLFLISFSCSILISFALWFLGKKFLATNSTNTNEE